MPFYRVTEKGMRLNNVHMSVGDIVELPSPLPGYAVNKCVPHEAPAETVAATIQPYTREQVLAYAAAALNATQFLQDGRPDLSSVNGRIPPEFAPFTAQERDALWPRAKEIAAKEIAGVPWR